MIGKQVVMEFPAPEQAGKHKLTLFFMCDSYMGADQEYAVNLLLGDEGAEAMEQD